MAHPLALRLPCVTFLLALGAGCQDPDVTPGDPTALARAAEDGGEGRACTTARRLTVPLADLRREVGVAADSVVTSQAYARDDGGYALLVRALDDGRAALLELSRDGALRSNGAFALPPFPAGAYGIGLARKNAPADRLISIARLDTAQKQYAVARAYGAGANVQLTQEVLPFIYGGRTTRSDATTSLDGSSTVYALGNLMEQLHAGLLDGDGIPRHPPSPLQIAPGAVWFCLSLVPTRHAALASWFDSSEGGSSLWHVAELDGSGGVRFDVAHPIPAVSSGQCPRVAASSDVVTALWPTRPTGRANLARLDRNEPRTAPVVRTVSLSGLGPVAGIAPSGPDTLMFGRSPDGLKVVRALANGAEERVPLQLAVEPYVLPRVIATEDEALHFYLHREGALEIYAARCDADPS